MNTYTLDPDADLDFLIDWAAPDSTGRPWLADGETITDQTVTAVDEGVTVHDVTQAAGKVIFWLKDGTVNTWQRVTCRVVTDQGRTDERTITVEITER